MQRLTTGLRLALVLAVASGLFTALPPVVVAAFEHLRIKSWRRTLGYATVSAVLAACALGVAVIVRIVTRHCGE